MKKTSEELRDFAVDSIAVKHGLLRRSIDPSTLIVKTSTVFFSRSEDAVTAQTYLEFTARLKEDERVSSSWEREYSVTHYFTGSIFDALEQLGV